MIDRHHGWNKSFKPLFIGLTLSFILMIAAYRLDTRYHLPPSVLVWAHIFLVLIQAVLLFVFYFHLGMEEKPAWSTLSIFFLIVVLIIIVGGSLWIMGNLAYNTMPGG